MSLNYLYKFCCRFTENFQKFFAPVVVGHVSSSVLIICFFILQLYQTVFLSFNFFQIVNSLIVIFDEVFFYCYYGTILFEEMC